MMNYEVRIKQNKKVIVRRKFYYLLEAIEYLKEILQNHGIDYEIKNMYVVETQVPFIPNKTFRKIMEGHAAFIPGLEFRIKKIAKGNMNIRIFKEYINEIRK